MPAWSQVVELIQNASAATIALAVIALIIPGTNRIVFDYLQSRFRRSVDRELEAIRSQLRMSEAKFQSELASSQKRLESLSGSIFSGQVGRSSANHARRLKAVEAIWSAKSRLSRSALALQYMSALDFRELSDLAAKDPDTKRFFKKIDDLFPIDELKLMPDVEAERPFLSPDVWAVFSAYRSIHTYSLMKLKILAQGLKAPDSLSDDHTMKLLKDVLPEFADYIDKYGAASYRHLAEHLDRKLAEATRAMLTGKDVDAEQLQHAEQVYRTLQSIDEEMLAASTPAAVAKAAHDASPPPD